MTNVTKSLFLVSALSLSALGLNSCGDKKPGIPTAQAAESAAPVTVKTAQVEMAPMAASLKVSGSLEGVREAIVSSETQGRIVSTVLNIGSRIGQGAAIVQVDAELKNIGVQQAAAQRLAAEASLEKAQLDHERNEQLFKQNAITKNQLELSAQGAGTGHLGRIRNQRRILCASVLHRLTDVRDALERLDRGRLDRLEQVGPDERSAGSKNGDGAHSNYRCGRPKWRPAKASSKTARQDAQLAAQCRRESQRQHAFVTDCYS